MTWKQFFTSSIGKKYIMGFTGFFLITFLIVHAAVNSLIFYNDKGETFDKVAHFMSHNYIIRFLELGLFAGIILHAIQGIILWRQNMASRPIGYARNKHHTKSKWYSRSMGLLGTLVLLFLIMHLYHFWLGSKNALYLRNDRPHYLYTEMQHVFSQPILVALYMLGLISLGFHLLHGFQSAFQTFGINHKKYTPLIQGMGIFYTVVIIILFALMPLSVYFHWLQ
ncbi:MAG: succinate dehydrogenase cytochrome b subunit [Chitinophagaceae bacterium]